MLIRPISVRHIESESEHHIGFVPQPIIGFEPKFLTLFVPNTAGVNHIINTINVDINKLTITPDVNT